ncbi:transposase domain-containing protein [Streptomyces sp. NPDC005336]|uniref:transposase domain-containing protein n=1 Tax=Streptomyces sp. NPDC005336 TaxID=3157035 RepID=UPI0033BA80A7
MERSGVAVAGRLTDDVSIGLLATVFSEEVVQAAIDGAGACEERVRSLPARLMMYLAMPLWLEPGKGYVRALRGLLEGLGWSRGGWDGYRVPTDGAISLARYRLGEAHCGTCSTRSRPRWVMSALRGRSGGICV